MSAVTITIPPIRPSTGTLSKMVGSSAGAQIAQLRAGGQSLDQSMQLISEISIALQDQINAINNLLKMSGSTTVQIDAQTPWTQNVDGGGFTLSNVSTVTVTTSVVSPLISTPHVDSPAGDLLLDTGSNAFDVRLGANVVIVRSAGIVRIAGVPVYANNAAAVTGGLGTGDIYRTGANPDPLCIVH